MPKDLATALSSEDHRGALILLMRDYGDRLYGYCYRLLGNPAIADDIHQTCFLRAYESMGSLKQASKAREWLFSIAHNCCMNELRRGKTESKHVSVSDPLPEVEVEQAVPNEDSASAHALKSMHECLKELKPHVRYAVLLRHQDEQPLTYEEMSRICLEQPKTLQVRVARALPVLRRCLERKGVTL